MVTDINTIREYNELIMSIYGESIEEVLLSTSKKISSYVAYTHSMVGFCCGTGKNFSVFGYKSNDISDEHVQKYINSYLSIDYTWWYIRQEQLRKEAYVIKATDIVSTNIIEQSVIHKEWHAPLNVFYTACICIASKGELYGYISLLRSKDQGDFTIQEIHFLEYVNSHLSKRFKDTYPKGLSCLKYDKDDNTICSKYFLTNREFEIVNMLQLGTSRDDIAKQLSISPHTLKKHISNIYNKLGISSMSQLYSIVNRCSPS